MFSAIYRICIKNIYLPNRIFISEKSALEMNKMGYGILIALLTTLTLCSTSEALHDIALNGTVTQSSNLFGSNGARAEQAIDANDGTCAHTEFELNAYWMVDLLDVYVIDHINIVSAMTNPSFHIDFSLGGTHSESVCYHDGALAGDYTCYPAHMNLARWVTIAMTGPSDSLALCSVEVMSYGKQEFFTLQRMLKGAGVPLKTTPVKSDIHCAYLCRQHARCININVVTNSDGSMECQLFEFDTWESYFGSKIAYWKLK